MDDKFPRRRRRPPDPVETAEGVRIIGAEEAELVSERDDVAHRLPDNAPRFGDRPESPPEDGPRPAIRFPLDASSDPGDVDRPPLVAPGPPTRRRHQDDPALPHWTEPATGEVPRIFATADDAGTDDETATDDLDAWSSFTSTPRWRGEGTASDADEYDDFSRLGDDETRVGALDSRERPGPDDFFTFDEYAAEPAPEEKSASAPRAISSDPRRTQANGPRSGGSYEPPGGAGRDVPVAAGVGLAVAALTLLLFKLGPRYAVALVTVVVVVAAAEFFNAVRRDGHQPATLLGIAASGSLVLAAYWKGEAAIPLVLFLTVVFGLLWYLAGAGDDDRPVAGLGITLAGVGYVGLLGSFGALILGLPDGIGVLLGAIVPTVAHDVGAFFVGRNAGRQPLSAASPNKTWEGLAGGWVFALLAAVIVLNVVGVEPWAGEFVDTVKLGIAVALAATLGDLCESLIKRDLGLKDMGEILPGHGGLLDRFDGLLFALPVTYYAARILIF